MSRSNLRHMYAHHFLLDVITEPPFFFTVMSNNPILFPELWRDKETAPRQNTPSPYWGSRLQQ